MIRSSRRSKACDACRAKKVKCDEGQPECRRCQRAGTVCPGPVLGRIFVNAGRVSFDQRSIVTQLPTGIHIDKSQTTDIDLERERQVIERSASSQTEDARLAPWQDTSVEEVEGISNDSAGTITLGGTVSHLKFLGEGRRDPFGTFGKILTAREEFLLDFFVRELQTSVYQGSLSSPFNPTRDACFSVVRMGAASLYVMFEFAEKHIAKLSGLNDTNSVPYQVQGIRQLNAALSVPSQRLLDPTIMAILGYIHILYQFKGGSFTGEKTRETKAHIRGVRCLINERGGFQALCDGQALSWIVMMSDLMTFGEISAGNTPLSSHGPISASSYSPSFCKSSSLDSFSRCSWMLVAEYAGAFCNFLHEAQRRSRERFPDDPEASTYRAISSLFRPGLCIHRLLLESPRIGYSRMSTILFFNVLLWDHRDNLASLFSGYFKTLRHTMVEQGLDLAGSIDLLLFTLVTDTRTYQVECRERVWLISRLLRIHNRLSAHLQAQVECALLHFIIGEDTNSPTPFDPETFYSVITHDLSRLGDDIFAELEGNVLRTPPTIVLRTGTRKLPQ